MKKFITIFLLMSGINMVAQTDRIDSLLNDLIYNDIDSALLIKKPVKYDFIYTGISYSSNTFYAGREIGNDIYSVSGHLFYYNTTGLFLGISGSWYDQFTPNYNSTTLLLGYSKSLDKKKILTLRTSYSRFIYNNADAESYYPYRNSLNLGLSFRKKWIGTRVAGNILFGDDSKINLSSAIYSRFNIIKTGKNNKVYSTPELSAYFSSEMITVNENSQNTDLTEKYGILNTQLSIPLCVSLGNFDLEFCYSINFPHTKDINISYPVKGFFSFSVGYMIPIAKK